MREIALAQNLEIGRLHDKVEQVNGKMTLMLDTFQESQKQMLDTFQESQKQMAETLQRIIQTLNAQYSPTNSPTDNTGGNARGPGMTNGMCHAEQQAIHTHTHTHTHVIYIHTQTDIPRRRARGGGRGG